MNVDGADKKITDSSRFLKKIDYNAKISKISGKIPIFADLVITSDLNVVENKLPKVSNLIKKTNYNTKNIKH